MRGPAPITGERDHSEQVQRAPDVAFETVTRPAMRPGPMVHREFPDSVAQLVGERWNVAVQLTRTIHVYRGLAI